MAFISVCHVMLQKPTISLSRKGVKEIFDGEVVCDSILGNKERTKSYWEAKMMAAISDQAIVPVYRSKPLENGVKNGPLNVPKFSDPNTGSLSGSSSPEPTISNGFESVEFEEIDDSAMNGEYDAKRRMLPKQYVFGLGEVSSVQPKRTNPKIVETVAKKPESHENVIEEEILAQQLREEMHKKEGTLKAARFPTPEDNIQESFIEREIRMQKEKEEMLSRERDLAKYKTESVGTREREIAKYESGPVANGAVQNGYVPTIVTTNDAYFMCDSLSPNPMYHSTEAKIAMEIRDMREREVELKRLREKFGSGDNLLEDSCTDNLNSIITTTDEGNFSEYGSEKAELSSEGNNSRIMSPEIPPNSSCFVHQRTQSMESMSSGHSSGGSGGQSNTYADFYTKRKVTVKPLVDAADPDETPSYLKIQKETPIEREIRLAWEREEELRKEKGLPPVGSEQPKKEAKKTLSRTHVSTMDRRDTQHRMATSRIQQEIDEATEREMELRNAGKIQTTSEERVDDKVTRLFDLVGLSNESALEREKKLLHRTYPSHCSSPENSSSVPKLNSTPVTSTTNCSSLSVISPSSSCSITPSSPTPTTSTSTLSITPNSSLPTTPISRVNSNIVFTPSPVHVPNFTPSPHYSLNRSFSANPVGSLSHVPSRKFVSPGPTQKGIMQKFLASRGKMATISAFNLSSNKERSSSGRSPIMPKSPTTEKSPVQGSIVDSSLEEIKQATIKDKHEQPSHYVKRRPVPTAQERIQDELKAMKEREDELRIHRRKLLALSQPNLAALSLDDELNVPLDMENEEKFSYGLRSAHSNPNLLDCNDSEQDAESQERPTVKPKGVRRKSLLIAQWENMIQQSGDN